MNDDLTVMLNRIGRHLDELEGRTATAVTAVTVSRAATPSNEATAVKTLPPSWQFLPIRDANNLIVEIIATPFVGNLNEH
jgi:hypothetical protein